MENNIISLIEFRDMKKRTYDGTTQSALCNRIKKIVHSVNTTCDTDEQIAEFIKRSFCINGILDSYNQLGRYGWCHMIMQMAQHEVYERSKNSVCI